jgi:hypothetical protein
MLVRAQEWPRNPERTLILGDARGQPPVRWVLLVSALLCGIMVSGAAFTIAWRSEARHRGAAQARLTDQHARVSELTRRTRRLRMAFVRERVALMR